MVQNKKEPDKKKEKVQDKADKWVKKAEEIIEDTSDKIYKSDTYKKADKYIDKTTKKVFRKAGKLWGKTDQYFKNRKKNN